jgi:membrane protease YdiL (CAAX protease family)
MGKMRTLLGNTKWAAAAYAGLAAVSIFSDTLSGITGTPTAVTIPLPAGVSGWAWTIIICFVSAFFEESLFRYWFWVKLEKKRPLALLLLVNAGVFGLFHLWEGVWGIVNAALAALVLSAVWLKSRSLPAIALSHALYNVSVFVFHALLETR